MVKFTFKLFKMFLLTFQYWTIWNFTLQLQLFIDHLYVSDVLKTGEHDHDFQGQICLET